MLLALLLGLPGKTAGADAADAPSARRADVAPLALPPHLRLDLPAVERILERMRAPRAPEHVLLADDGVGAAGLPAFGRPLAGRLSLDGGIDVAPGAYVRAPFARLGLAAAPADRFTLSATMAWRPIGTGEPLATNDEAAASPDAVPEPLRSALGDPFRLSPRDHQLDVSASWTPTDSLALVLDYATLASRIPEAGSLRVRYVGGTLGWSFAGRAALNLGANAQDLGGTAVGTTFRVWNVTASGTLVLADRLETVVAVNRDSFGNVALFAGLRYGGG